MGVKCPKCHFENPPDSKFCKECGTQLFPVKEISVSPTKTLQIPVRELKIDTLFAGRYQILEELGKGGMGRVYKALDREINEEVAVKLLKPEIAADESTIDRFRNELKFARKISHKNVCRMYHLSKEEETPYITMEYVEGEDLKSLVRREEKIAENEAVKIAKQVCEGLAEAHRLGVIHRDLKPQNVMIDKEGNAKIMDFGIARSVAAPGVTATGMIIGTPDYISPEQAEGEEADERSDIYSLGVILYEMVTGDVPFKGDTAFSVALKHKSQLPQDPRKLNPEVSENLSYLILICMEKDKERRYQKAEDLLSDLKNLEEGLPLGTKIRPRRKTFVGALIRKKLFIPAAVVALAIIVVAIWQALPQKEAVLPPKIENSIAVISFENLTGDESYDILQKAIPNLLITSLENTGYLYVATWERMRDLLKQMGEKDVEFIDSDLGFELCKREGIEAIVLGSFMKAGDTFATDVKVLDVETKKLMKSASSKGKTVDSILENQIDELSRDIMKGVGIGREKIEKPQVVIADITTSSIEAYNYFLRGREAYEKNNFPEAKQSLERAIDIDPTMAMAYVYLSKVYPFFGEWDAGKEAMEKAKAHSQKATEKESLFIEASFETDEEKRFRIVTDFMRKYPREKEAHRLLGSCYSRKKMVKQAIEEWNKALELDPTYYPALAPLVYTYTNLEDFEKAIEIFKKYEAVAPITADLYDSMGEMYFRMGKLDQAIAKYKEAIGLNPNWFLPYYSIGYIYALKEDYREAMKWTDQMIDAELSPQVKSDRYTVKGFYHYWLGSLNQSLLEHQKAMDLVEEIESERDRQEWKAWIEWMKGWIYYDKGEIERSLRCSKSAFDLFMKWGRYKPEASSNYSFYLGLVDLKQGRIDSAKSRLAEMNSVLPEISPNFKNSYKFSCDILQGEILLAEDSVEKAIAFLEKQSPLGKPPNIQNWIVHNLPFIKDVLARAYRKNGEIDKAIAEYERFFIFDLNRKERYLIHPKYHYRIAKLYEEKGRKGKAIEQYEKFLNLWKDADPGFPEVDDAKERLAALRSQ